MQKTEQGTIYETLGELMNANIESVYEDSTHYYFHLVPECFYENAVWVVEKENESVSYMMYTEFIFDVMHKTNAKKIDWKTLKRSS